MGIILIDDASLSGESLDIKDIQVEPVTSPGPLLDASYALLLRVFDPTVVDPFIFYLDALAENEASCDNCASIFLAAYFEHNGDKLLCGFNSSTLMKLQSHPAISILAVGNIATSPKLRAAGFRGIGTALSDAALKLAAAQASRWHSQLSYAVSEAEPESLGFWKKQGYLWPSGVQYLQPPLDFDESGVPVYPEVDETLVLAPLGSVPSDEISVELLRDIIVTIYENWCLSSHRSRLSFEAMREAETYVMENVFGRVSVSIPSDGTVRLITPPQIAPNAR